MQESFLKKIGIYYRVNQFRAGRQTLVFIHGLGGSSSAWLPYERVFESDYNILSLDLRGHGKSGKHPAYRDYEIKNFAKDISELITHLQIKECTLISHSFGTLIALTFLLEHPSVATAAIFLSPNFGIAKMRSTPAVRFFLDAAIKIIRLFPAASKPGRHIDYAKYPNVGDWDIPLNFADIPNTGLHTFLFCTKQAYATDLDESWSRLRLPILILHGKNDTIIPVENAIRMAKQIPQSKLILVDDANHLFVLNDPAAVCRSLKDFLKAKEREQNHPN